MKDYNVAVEFGVEGLMKIQAADATEAMETARRILQNLNWAQVKNNNKEFGLKAKTKKKSLITPSTKLQGRGLDYT